MCYVASGLWMVGFFFFFLGGGWWLSGFCD